MVPLMIRSWGAHLYGEWIILTAIPAYLMLSPDFGLGGAAVNQMALATAKGDRAEAVRLYRSSWAVLTILGIVFVLAGSAVGAWVRWTPFGITELSNRSAEIIGLSCLQIFVLQLQNLLGGIYRSARRNPRCGLLWSLGSTLTLVSAIASLLLNADPTRYLIAVTASRIATVCIMLIDAQRIMPDFTLGLRGISFRAIRPYIVPGFGHAGLPLVNALQNEGMVLVLGALVGPLGVTIYQTTRTVVNGAKSLISIIATAIYVEIPTLVGEGRLNSVRSLLAMTIQTGFLAALSWLLLMAFGGRAIFHLWLHDRVPYSESLFLLMLTSILPFAFSYPFNIFLQATNTVHRAITPLVLGGMLSVATAAAGTYLMGLIGAALGLLTFEVCTLTVVCWTVARHTQLSVKRTMAGSLSPASLLTAYDATLAIFRRVRA